MRLQNLSSNRAILVALSRILWRRPTLEKACVGEQGCSDPRGGGGGSGQAVGLMRNSWIFHIYL